MSLEGRIYVCSWNKMADGSIRGVVKRPRIVVIAESFDDLAEKLTDAITEQNGDGEPQIEFEPPVAGTDRQAWFKDGIVVLAAKAHFRCEDYSKLVSGYCKHCLWALGERTEEMLVVNDIWAGDAANCAVADNGLNVLLISESLLKSFSRVDRSAFDVRTVIMPKRARKTMFEVVPKALVPEVTIKTLKVDGWHCKRCGTGTESHGRTLGWGVPAISRDSIPKQQQVFFIGTPTDYHLCMKAKRWNALKNQLRKAAFTSERVAVIEAGEIGKPRRSEQIRKPRKKQ